MGASTYAFADWTLARAQHELEDAGLVISTVDEAFPATRFRDVEAIVYFLKAVPWQVPDFTVARYVHQLRELSREIEVQGSVDVTAHRFLVVGHKAG